jgi:cytidyltransferase-like protein
MSNCVLIGGVFDPLHAGHLAYIQAAKHIAGGRPILCHVSDNPDKHPPVVPLADRERWLAEQGLHVVDGMTVADCLRLLRVETYIKGRDWEGKLPQEEVDACEKHGIEIVYTDTMTNSSTGLLSSFHQQLNAEKLAAFERLVQRQKPADREWAPVTDYSRETRRAIEAPQADIIAEVFKGLSVLDYGCGFGFLVELLKERGMAARGWDPVYAGGLQSLLRSSVVICREVLEHLTVREVAATVRRLVVLSHRYVYVTTRFTSKPHLLDVDTADTLDPTHITMLNQDFLRTLFVLEGCTRCPELEAKLDHQKKGRVLVYQVPA